MKQDVLYAATNDGSVLPVIDITQPAFAVSIDQQQLHAMSEEFVLESKQRQAMLPALRDALKNSLLGKGLMAASGSVLSGLGTYLLKLGPDNLGASAQAVDRAIASSFPAFNARIRLQDMARLIADSLASSLAAVPHRPVHLVNVAGGPAADSWNALIYLRRENVSLLTSRPILIAVLDVDDEGPGFGARAIAALRRPGAPLAELEISLRHIPYNWAQSDQLRHALDSLKTNDAVCVTSSEGGLFEYGSDEEILSNLEVLRLGTPRDASVVGSVTRDGEPVRSSRSPGSAAIRPRTKAAFEHLAKTAGWNLERVIERPFSYHILLVKS